MEKRIKDNFEQAIKILEATPQEEFDMAFFRQKAQNMNRHTDFISQDNCGTVGCALGTIAAAGKGDLVPIQYVDSHRCGDLNWDHYSSRVFSIGTWDKEGCWDFLFSSHWQYYDNTPSGAAARMRYYLDNKDKIENNIWKFQDFQEGWDK